MSEQRNLILAIGLSMAIFMGYDYVFPTKAVSTAQNQITQNPAQANEKDTPTNTETQTNIVAPKLNRCDAVTSNHRLPIASDKIHGSLNLKGGMIDDITLKNYKETPDQNSENIVLLSPNTCHDPYYINLRYAKIKDVTLPNENTVWTVKDGETSLKSGGHVILTHTTKEGVIFKRKISLDDQFLFTVSERVINRTKNPITLKGYNEITRQGTPETSGFFILHEGPIGFLEGKLREMSYEDLQEKKDVDFQTKGGWLGFTDKYWLVSVIPDQSRSVTTSFQGSSQNTYKTNLSYDAEIIQSGADTTNTYHIFAGPKKLRMLDAYEEKIGFQHFDLAVDFGWFYFLTKPVFYVLDYFNTLLGNFGLAILALTILFKLLMFPLANKSFYSMARMRKLAPKIEQLKDRVGDDKMKLNTELMALYKREGVNPMSGCLPMLIQAPIFFCLYKVLFVTIEMRHAPFFGWIQDLSAVDPTTIFNLFGLIPWNPPSFLMLGAWPLIMGATMIIQQKLNPPPSDPVQAKMMMLMPILFTYLLASFPAGLVIYWAWSNVLTIIQQFIIMRLAEKNPS